MSNIHEIDKNFAVISKIEKVGIKFYNPEEAPFKMHGVFREGDLFVRMPDIFAKKVSQGVEKVVKSTSGGRIRFKTNSPYVAISVKYGEISGMPHMTYCGSAGFDLYYEDENGMRFKNTFIPSAHGATGYENIINLPDSKMREITINMPLYIQVSNVYIGLDENAEILPPRDYKISKPIVYYGSSITQGGCASRPGMAYPAIISRALDCDFINLGVSGNAKGEQEMADYIKSLDMSLFVMDYDANAGTAEHLEATHYKMYEAIRKAQPQLPILMVSYHGYYLSEGMQKRRDIIKGNYEQAKANGDKNIYFIPGDSLMGDTIKEEGTVDNLHLTDLGFFQMAQKLIPVIKEMLSNMN